MAEYVTAGPELRSLMSDAANLPVVNTKERIGEKRANGFIKGHDVEIVDSWVQRNSLDGWVHTLALRSFVDGKRVSRARLYTLCGESV